MVLLEVLAIAAYLHYRQQKKIKKLEAALEDAGVPAPERRGLKRCGRPQMQWQGNVRGGGMVPKPPVQPGQQQQQGQGPVRYYDDEKKDAMAGMEGEGEYYADEKARTEVLVEENLPHYGVVPDNAQDTQQYTHPSTWDNDDYNKIGNPTMNKFDDWVDVQVAKGKESIKGYFEKVNQKTKES